MGIGDGIIKFWVQNFYGPKLIKYEPGFIVTEFDNKYGKAFQRLVLLPESICIEIENQICNKYGAEGRDILIQIGKLSGYNFGITLDAPRISTHGEKFVKDYSCFLINYGMSSWAKGTKILMYNLISNEYSIQYDNHAVCSKNGNGILFTEYQLLGFLEYMLERPLVLKSSKCQGRGNDKCEIDYSIGSAITSYTIYKELSLQLYKTINKIKPIVYSKQSFTNLLKTNIMQLEEGRLFFNKQCMLPIHETFLSFLEIEAYKLKGCHELIYDLGFKWGSTINGNLQDITDLMSVFGFGDLFIKREDNKYIVSIDNYPWNPLSEKQDSNSLVRGIISGMLSKITSNKVILSKVNSRLNNEKYCIILS